MNPRYLGDSYDLVKRFFCHELSLLGYSVVVDPMLTGNWGANEQEFYRLIGARPMAQERSDSTRVALFLDPDSGISEKGDRERVSIGRLAQETTPLGVSFSFHCTSTGGMNRGRKASIYVWIGWASTGRRTVKKVVPFTSNCGHTEEARYRTK